ncbi:MAG: LacI family transcriptional regulator [Spirochaetaceae bacterium]|nr:MAG: LacI family transcriptional regulator [Spirochaetaceae bacterium]
MSNTKSSRADVAREAGVAESTVSRALNDSPLISDEVKARVRAAAVELGYVLNRQAAMFARNRAGAIGMVVPRYASFPPFSRAYFPAVLDGVVVAAEERGYFVTIILERENTTAEMLAQLVSGRSVDGLLFTVTPAMYDRYEYLDAEGLPFVFINNYHDGMFGVDSLPEPGMRKAFARAVELGHQQIGYVAGDLRFKNGQDRLAVFQKLCSEHGIVGVVCDGDFSRTSGYRCCETLLRDDPDITMIMTASDRSALGVLAYCEEHGINVPEDMSVVGYDDLHPAQDAFPPLSTVQNPIEKSGWTAANMIIDVVEGIRSEPTTVWLDTDYVDRQSTGIARVPRKEPA